MDTFVTPKFEHPHPCFLYLLFSGGEGNQATTFRNISMGDFTKNEGNEKKQDGNWRLFG